jgi:putative flavoprotein involved in K+ transport
MLDSSQARRRYRVVIIGAGPSGLALGAELRTRGIDFIIVEKGEVGDSWARMPKQLKLVSPWKCNWLTPETCGRFSANAQLTRAEFLDYLRRFADDRELPVLPNVTVEALRRSDGQFALSTSQGEFSADIVVNAAGYFANPVWPRLPGEDDTSIKRLHYAEFADAQQIISLASGHAQVLIVGKRLSAGQTALELHDAGLRVAISHRTPIEFGVDDWLWPLVYRTFAHVEAVRLRLPGRVGQLDVRMQGGRARKLIQSGAILTFPALNRFERDQVVFENGMTLAADVVIYATGFAPNLKFLSPLNFRVCSETGVPLVRDMESETVPNLFFLGFEMLHNFQSRFLRGIRRDAVVLADIIGSRAVTLPKREPREFCTA